MAKKQTRVNPAVLEDLVDFMNNPPGGGDMLKSVYDADNDGKVDQAEEADTLDGQHASAFASSGHDHDADYAPIAEGVSNGDAHDHVGGDGAAIAEGALSLSDVTTGDLSTAKHGFAPKAPNDTTKFLRGDGAWAAPAGGGGLGYSLQGACFEVVSISDNTTYYFGSVPKAINTAADRSRIYIPKAGTIKAAYVFWNSPGAGAGSGEDISVYIRKNNTDDTLIATIGQAANFRIFSNTSLNISVNQGDYFEFKLVTPYWVTNPSNASLSGVVYIE